MSLEKNCFSTKNFPVGRFRGRFLNTQVIWWTCRPIPSVAARGSYDYDWDGDGDGDGDGDEDGDGDWGWHRTWISTTSRKRTLLNLTNMTQKTPELTCNLPWTDTQAVEQLRPSSHCHLALLPALAIKFLKCHLQSEGDNRVPVVSAPRSGPKE